MTVWLSVSKWNAYRICNQEICSSKQDLQEQMDCDFFFKIFLVRKNLFAKFLLGVLLLQVYKG